MIYEATIEIERPIDEVFEAGTCKRRCVVWMNSANSRMDSEQPVQVGSTFSWEYRFLSITYSCKAVITELDPPHTFAFKSIEGPDFSSHYTFTPTERGTRFHMTYESELQPPLLGLVSNGLVKSALETAFKRELEQLKVLMENDVDLWALTPPLPST